jgi:LuxR family maltose regulon positive regulatory protein
LSIPILATKVYLPRAHSDPIRRNRLIEKLDSGLKKRLTLISAPPGFGKTSLLAGWLRERQHHVAWLSLDSRDNDPTRFLSYLIAACKTIGDANGRTGFGDLSLGVLQANQPKQVEMVLTTLINEIIDLAEIFGSRSLPLLLVLDDYHVIVEQSVHEAMELFIQGLPPDLHLIIASRVDPDLPLARWRIQDAVLEIRAADLRFSSAEISEFLEGALGYHLSSKDILALEARTEGWIAGLQVAALSMRERDDVSAFIETFTGSNRYILEFLNEEVLDQLPAEVRGFLLQTSILERLCGPLCDALTGLKNGQALLGDLDRDNIFLVRLDDHGTWFRYYPLFREFLADQLSRSDPENVGPLHKTASEWLEQNGYTPEAIEHALASGSMEQAISLVEDAAGEVVAKGEWGMLQSWLSALGKERLIGRQELCLAQAWTLLYTGTQEETEVWLAYAEQHLPMLDSAAGRLLDGGSGEELSKQFNVGKAREIASLRGEVLAIRATLASMLGDTKKTIELGRRSLDFLPEDDEFLRSAVILSIGIAHRYKGDATEAKAAFQQAVLLSQKVGNRYQTLDGLCNLANIQILEGDYNQARETITLASSTVLLPSGKPSPIASEVFLLDGVWSYERNALEQAAHSIAQSILLNDAQRINELQYAGQIWLSRVLRAKGDLSRAARHMDRAAQLAIKSNMWRFRAHTAAVRAELATFMGDLEAAEQWAGQLAESRADRVVDLPRMKEFEDIMLAHVYMATDQPDRVPDLLTPLLDKAEIAGRMDSVYRMTAYLSLALAEVGDPRGALEKMKWLLPKTANQGYARLYLDCGRAMAELLQVMNVNGVMPAYTRRLLVAFSEEALKHDIEPSTRALLSERETEVLLLIGAGRSNREIADDLVITVGTVKRHISNIYGKLGVGSRTQAVAKARELNLVD